MIEIGLILTLLVAVIIFFTYWIPKKLGFSKIGKYLSIVLLLLIISSITFVIFEDDLFSKSDVRDLLSEQNIQIKDDFEIEENKSIIAPGDYYHTFTLSIAPSDKNRLSDEIKRSPNFNKDKLVETYLYDQSDYHYGPKRIKNYEQQIIILGSFLSHMEQVMHQRGGR